MSERLDDEETMADAEGGQQPDTSSDAHEQDDADDPDAPLKDAHASTAEDTGEEDAGEEDAGEVDAGDDDASEADASETDEADAGAQVAGDQDAGDEDARDDASEDAGDASEDAGDEDAGDKDAGDKDAAEPPKKASVLWWLLPAAVILEFWIYGHNGTIEVCVGKEGQTDFSLIGSERTDDNRWSFPRCETRLNLGLRSEFDAQAADAKKIACRGATLFKNRGEAAQCEASEDGWTERVDGQFCPPWDPNYYEHLFWFLK